MGKNNYKKVFVISALIIVVVGCYFFFKNNNQVIESDSSKFNTALFESEKDSYGLRVIRIDQQQGEPAELSVYFDKNDGSTKLVEASYGGETFNHHYTYYFNSINDFLLVEKAEQWDRPYNEEGRTKTVDKTDKYLFSNLKMTEWLDSTNSVVSTNSEKFKQKQLELLQQLDLIMAAINSKTN